MAGESQSSAIQPLPQGEQHWLAPARIACTGRAGGLSTGEYAANNLALHVQDDPQVVAKNRRQLFEYKELFDIQWLSQVHGTKVLAVGAVDPTDPTADAMYTTEPGLGLAILTADCLPVVLVDRQGELVAAAHAGWRGLCAGILSELVAVLPVPAARLQAFIGPAIGPGAFEVGPEVVEALDRYGLNPATVSESSRDASGALVRNKFQVDLALAAKLDLQRNGVGSVSGGHWCTFSDERFYSWRRTTHLTRGFKGTPVTGRQATLVWLPAAAETA